MSPDGDFSVEDFLQAIAAQLDRTQDAMRLKAVNRPLTYAIRDFSLELKVFVSMDEEGVRLRSAGPGDVGASTIQIGFTTMTAPMIEEATIPLTMTMAPRLDELGLSADERKRLERLGVSNAAQLNRLGQYTGATTVSRWSNIPIERLRAALQLGRPKVRSVEPAGNGAPPEPPPVVEPPVTTPPVADVPVVEPPIARPPFRPPGRFPLEDFERDVGRKPRLEREPVGAFVPVAPDGESAPATPVFVAPGTNRLRLAGRNLLNEGGPPLVKLDGRELPVVDAFDDHVLVDLPEGTGDGELSVEFADGVQTYALSFGVPTATPSSTDRDPWRPAP
jgi:hypothetical protein